MRTLFFSVTKFISLTLLLLIVCLVFPFTRIIPSMGIMMMNNINQSKNSIPYIDKIEVHMPAGRIDETQQWYPFLLTYNASASFSKVTGRDIDLTIVYNFGAYDYKTGRSKIYSIGSPYNGAFYGAYFIKEKDIPFSFLFDASGVLKEDSIAKIAEFDYMNLVLMGLGAETSKIGFELGGCNL